MKTKVIIAAAVLLTLNGCVTTTNEGTVPGKSTGFLGRKQNDIKVTTDKAFAGAQKIAIGSFKVGFIEEGKSSAKAGRGFGGKATAKLELTGVPDSVKQQITDAAYADFINQLKALGYEVIDYETLIQDADYAKSKAIDLPFKTDNSPYALGQEITYLAPSGFDGLRLFQKDGMGLKGGIGFNSPTMAAVKYAEQTGSKVVSVNYIVDFANAAGSGGSFRSTASVSVGQGLSVKPGSGVELIGGQGGTFSKNNGSIELGQPVFTTETFAEVIEDTSTANKSIQYAANAVSLLGGMGSNISRSYEIRANPEQYKTLVNGLLNETSSRLISEMAALR